MDSGFMGPNNSLNVSSTVQSEVIVCCFRLCWCWGYSWRERPLLWVQVSGLWGNKGRTNIKKLLMCCKARWVHFQPELRKFNIIYLYLRPGSSKKMKDTGLKYPCPDCKESFRTPLSVMKHLVEHKKKGILNSGKDMITLSRLRCTRCQHSFKDIKDLQLHIGKSQT